MPSNDKKEYHDIMDAFQKLEHYKQHGVKSSEELLDKLRLNQYLMEKTNEGKINLNSIEIVSHGHGKH
ncbi:unnamed protein product [Ambrosiozyma monospora]|uniref:Unnamed protein product n=1 Tax=Ambrosiozyma monospora TaxID=43982 RepID=A0A9W7DIZ9_AMBMO|nr:unnamed protein product [Ambrosiozyma monospora]